MAERPPDLAWFWPGVLCGALLALLVVAALLVDVDVATGLPTIGAPVRDVTP